MGFYTLNLDELRSQAQGQVPKTPFEHQLDAFAANRRPPAGSRKGTSHAGR